jgi:phosphate butyryltransferase
MIKNFEELINTVKKRPSKAVVIAAAHSDTAIDAAIMAKRENLAECVMTGDKQYIIEHLRSKAEDLIDSFEIHDTGTDLAAGATKAIQLIKEGRAQIIQKGKCDTRTLLRAILNKETGLHTGETMSDVLVYETPERLMLMGDGGFLPRPDLNDKISIVKNCVKVAHALGNEMPKVAMLTHTEAVDIKQQSTVDAALISQMSERNQIKGCIIYGPMAFDNAVSKKAAKLKGIESEVAGDADILIVPNIESGNIFGKALTYYCRYRVAHVAMGAQVPLLIASRVDNAETKYLSMVLGMICA